MTLLLGLDTGGTYTDAVLFDPDARAVAASGKALTTKHDLAIGLRGAIDAVLPQGAASDAIGLVSLSTTLATNAIVEGQGSPVCLVLIGYDAHALDRAGLRAAMGQDPVVHVAGGHSPAGDPQAPLDLDGVLAAARAHAPHVAAFAVSGFFSVRNPAHEIAARDGIRAATGLPVTCGHELTARLDAPRRALTAALNARLIPQLAHLIEAIQRLLAERGIGAPLMVVKGDGSLISAEAALQRPVETILSGPAASVVGARFLSGEDEVVVSDIGGTTTDVALLRGGRPVLSPDGATVGRWRTMVEAIAVHTFGLGGDSEIRLAEGALAVGPRRVVPLSLLAVQHPAILDSLASQGAAPRLDEHAGRFALRQRPLDTAHEALSRPQAAVWARLADGPLPLAALGAGYAAQRALQRLVERGLVVLAGFTPSDAAHLVGLQQGWSVEAARLGAAIALRLWQDNGLAEVPDDPESVARVVIEAVVARSARAVAATVLGEQDGVDIASGDAVARRLVDRAVAPPDGAALIEVRLALRRPLVAIGAPARLYYPEAAARLGTRLVLPPNGEVCNAVGAVVGGIMQSATALVTAPAEGRFRVHFAAGVRDFADLAAASGFAEAEARRLAAAQAAAMGAEDPELRVATDDKIVRGEDGGMVFLERRLTATAFGRPRIAAE
jgi:N-methylhydantoinase A/oxoprolinase/acetone carboxylase beta subunit